MSQVRPLNSCCFRAPVSAFKEICSFYYGYVLVEVFQPYLLPTLLFHHVSVEWEVVQLGGFRTPTFGHRSALPTPSFIHAAIASSSTVWNKDKGERGQLGGEASDWPVLKKHISKPSDNTVVNSTSGTIQPLA